MTATNPHPLANPFNRSRYAAYEMGQQKKAISHCSDPSKLEVPDSTVSFSDAIQMQPNSHNDLHVPYTAPDDLGAGCSGMSFGSFGFVGNSSLFVLHDGSVLDLKAHKIVLDPNKKFKANGYWNNPDSVASKKYDSKWGKVETIASLLAAKEAAGDTYDPNMSPESARYWQKAKEESKKLEQNMTDEQKKLLQALEAEQFFPKTKLVEER